MELLTRLQVLTRMEIMKMTNTLAYHGAELNAAVKRFFSVEAVFTTLYFLRNLTMSPIR